MLIKIYLVGDSAEYKNELQRGITAHSENDMVIVGYSADPEIAFSDICSLKPDVAVLDIEMASVDGIAFLRRLVAEHPIPVVVATSLPINALNALKCGAVDFVKKPASNTHDELHSFILKFVEKLVVAATATVLVPEKHIVPKVVDSSVYDVTFAHRPESVIAIGASTGGTEAIIEVVKNLPETTPGIVIVQHMPATFTTLYAQRLDKVCRMRAKEAADGDRVEQGLIIVAAGNYHLTLDRDVTGYFVRSRLGERVSGHCPSVDVLFDSVAETAGANALGVILTGMGADGAKGIKKMHQNGAFTIGQDKDSCVVYGMPMEAYKLGGIDIQLPLNEIGEGIITHLQKNN